MQQIYMRARAKINLTLDVTGKRPDGYHNVKMIMQTLNLHDQIMIRKIRNNEIQLRTNLRWLPNDSSNLAYKAAHILRENYGISQGIFIDLKKRIPVAAGLAGGSSDAAAVLVGINKLFGLGITTRTLMEIGKHLGADVPYCIMRGTALAEGIGEHLTRLAPMPKCYVVLAKPSISVSTAYVYQNLNLQNIHERPYTDEMIHAIEQNNIEEIARNMCNVLESVTINRYPVIQDIKEFLIQQGALGAMMSGSGPTVFGLFRDKEAAVKASYKLRLYNKAKNVFVTTIFNEEK